MIRSLTSLLLLGTASAGLVQMEPSVTHFSGPGWKQEEKTLMASTDGATVDVVFALKHDSVKLDILEEKLLDISNPQSKSYGNYLSKEQATELIAPETSALETVKIYLEEYQANDIKIAVSKNAWKTCVP
jgi:hypothetical protein